MKFGAIRTAALLAAALAVGVAQGRAMRAHHAAPPTAPAYAPGLGEIMSLQQMRHFKLWAAGNAGNWDLAAYELDELKEGFDDVRKLFPTHDGVPLTSHVEAIEKRPIPDLAAAIEARDGPKFADAFDALSASCNACHQAAKHGFIVIQRPTNIPYSNQSFAPAAH